MRQGALTIHTEKPFYFFLMKCQIERLKPVKIFCSRRNASFFISTEMTGISCTICKNLTRAILSPTIDDFVNLGTSRPSLPSSTGSFLTNGTALYFDPLFVPKNPPENSMQMVSTQVVCYLQYMCFSKLLCEIYM